MRVFPSVTPVQCSSASVRYSSSSLFSENNSLESAELKSGIITADFSMPVVKLVYLVLSVLSVAGCYQLEWNKLVSAFSYRNHTDRWLWKISDPRINT